MLGALNSDPAGLHQQALNGNQVPFSMDAHC
jgi:hypothetical protein